jgi:hypothetical protein
MLRPGSYDDQVREIARIVPGSSSRFRGDHVVIAMVAPLQVQLPGPAGDDGGAQPIEATSRSRVGCITMRQLLCVARVGLHRPASVRGALTRRGRRDLCKDPAVGLLWGEAVDRLDARPHQVRDRGWHHRRDRTAATGPQGLIRSLQTVPQG